jgi:L-malate glycosyltransferase
MVAGPAQENWRTEEMDLQGIAGLASAPLVVHLISSLHLGGTERQLVTLLSGLDPRRWRSRVVCFHATGGHLDELRGRKIELTELRLPSSLASPRIALAILRLARQLRREGAAVLHCHDLYANLVGVLAGRLAGIPVIASRRDLGHHLSRTHRLALRLVLPAAARVLVNARAVADQVSSHEGAPRTRIVVVPNGIDLRAFDREARREPMALPPELAGARVVLSVGHFVHSSKGQDDLLRAIALLGPAAGALRFVMVGGGPFLEPTKRAAATLGVAGRVHFLGTRGDVPALLARAHLVCHASRLEGMPNAVLEAMAAGRAIVATRAGGTGELLGDGQAGVLVPTGDPRALADALSRLAADPERQCRLGLAARRRVAAEFSLERLVGRVEALYRDPDRGDPGAAQAASGVVRETTTDRGDPGAAQAASGVVRETTTDRGDPGAAQAASGVVRETTTDRGDLGAAQPRVGSWGKRQLTEPLPQERKKHR